MKGFVIFLDVYIYLGKGNIWNYYQEIFSNRNDCELVFFIGQQEGEGF